MQHAWDNLSPRPWLCVPPGPLPATMFSTELERAGRFRTCSSLCQHLVGLGLEGLGAGLHLFFGASCGCRVVWRTQQAIRGTSQPLRNNVRELLQQPQCVRGCMWLPLS